jgi:hypothetical protein
LARASPPRLPISAKTFVKMSLSLTQYILNHLGRKERQLLRNALTP